MKIWVKVFSIVMLVIGISSFAWFLLGATAFFQRGMDIIGTTILLSVGALTILIIIIFTIILVKRRFPTNRASYAGYIFGLVALMILSFCLIKSVHDYGWMEEKIARDTIKTTADEKVEYQIELINLFQRNSYARLYIKHLDTGHIQRIPLELQTNQIRVLFVSRVNHWVFMKAADEPSHYILHTTDDLHIPEKRFDVDIAAGTARRLE